MANLVQGVLNRLVNTVEAGGQRMDELLPKVEEMLVYSWKDQAPGFKELLKANGALLAGGSLVTASIDLNPSDLDIYVPIQNIPALKEGIKQLFRNLRENLPEDNVLHNYEVEEKYIESSFYSRSFLRRNGIRCIYRLTVYTPDTQPGQLLATRMYIDIMAVRKSRKPIDVVTNFDLSFCQVWYDGEAVYSSHPDHLRKKEGILQGDYVYLYLRGNKFLRNRCNKYQQYPRFFKITLDPEVTKNLSLKKYLERDFFRNKQTKDDAYWLRWSTKQLMRFLLTKKFTLPLDQHKYTNNGVIKGMKSYYNDQNMPYEKELDGYDSEEYSQPDFANLKKLSPDHFYLPAHNLLWEMYDTIYTRGYPKKTYVLDNQGQGFVDHVEQYKNLMKKIGVCVVMGTDDEPVWYFHQHKKEEGISADGLQGYLNEHMKDIDKTEIPCLIPGCKEKFTRKHIQPLVEPEFWKKFQLPGNIDLKVPKEMFETVLKDEKTWATTESVFGNTIREVKKVRDGWGPLYHHVLCPYCLQPEYRRAGCGYMHHEAPGPVNTLEDRLPSPFCQKHNVIPELRKKYFDAWRKEYPTGFYLEFCVTCGRPSAGHMHFDLADEPKLIEYVEGPADHPMEGAYTKCMGGGRPEMIARMLAMKQVIEEQEFDDDFEQRRACALAADQAPKNAALMNKARAIFAKERRKRGTYETFDTADAANLPENDVVQTLEQQENIVNLEPDQLDQYRANLAAREQALVVQQQQQQPQPQP